MTIVLIVAVFILVILSGFIGNRAGKNQDRFIRKYKYFRRDYIMTRSEAELFRRLEKIAAARYYVFPQVHLSSLLDHKVKNGQSWKGALSAIQRKSVDFVLVDKTSLQTAYAVELDDYTHDRPERQKRDEYINKLLEETGVPLLRLRNLENLSDQDIMNAFSAVQDKFQKMEA